MPNEAEGSLDKRTNGLESAAQVSSQKSGPYDLMKSEAASTMQASSFRLPGLDQPWTESTNLIICYYT